MNIEVRVKLNAKENKLTGKGGCEYGARLREKPVDGRANKELIAMVAEHFGVKEWQVSIIKGLTSRKKIIKIEE